MTNAKPLELLTHKANIRDAMQAIERSLGKIAVIVDDDSKLLGTVTDGDIRRALLSGGRMDSPIISAMNPNPDYGHIGENTEQFIERMQSKRRRQLPVVDDDNHVVEIVTISSLTQTISHDNLVFILVGGLGSRLHPLTESAPKPMIPIGDKPILEHIVEKFVAQGFTRFCFAMRYRYDQIVEHFQDGSAWNAKIDYIKEIDPLGTAGPLALLEKREEKPIIVMNGDILTSMQFHGLIDFHYENDSCATIGARPYSFEIPYGVIEADGVLVSTIKEKPTIDVMINAGIYCLDWDIVDLIKAQPNARIDMPDVLRQAKTDGKTVNIYPVYEYWVDIGQKDDLNRARLDYDTENRS